VKREYLMAANPGLMPTEKWKTAGIRVSDNFSQSRGFAGWCIQPTTTEASWRHELRKWECVHLFDESEDFTEVTLRKAIPLHAKKTLEGVASCKPRPLYVQVKRRRRWLDPRAGTDVTLSRFEPRFLCCPVRRLMFVGGCS